MRFLSSRLVTGLKWNENENETKANKRTGTSFDFLDRNFADEPVLGPFGAIFDDFS